MAIQSLFGPSIADIQELRRQEAEKQLTGAGQEFGVFAPLYQASMRFGNQAASGINTLMGVQDPMLKKATDISSILSGYQGQDLNDPNILSRIAGQLAEKGYSREAMMVANEANQRITEQKKLNLLERETVVREEDVRARKAERESQVTDVGTTVNGIRVFRKATGGLFVEEGDQKVTYDAKKHGRFQTQADTAEGGVTIKDIPGPGGVGVIGREIYDRKGNLIRREMFSKSVVPPQDDKTNGSKKGKKDKPLTDFLNTPSS